MIATYYPAFVAVALGVFAAGMLFVSIEDQLRN